MRGPIKWRYGPWRTPVPRKIRSRARVQFGNGQLFGAYKLKKFICSLYIVLKDIVRGGCVQTENGGWLFYASIKTDIKTVIVTHSAVYVEKKRLRFTERQGERGRGEESL